MFGRGEGGGGGVVGYERAAKEVEAMAMIETLEVLRSGWLRSKGAGGGVLSRAVMW